MTQAEGLSVPDLQWDVLKPHWEAAHRHEFRLPRCSGCGRFNWYPKATCVECGASDFTWALLSGRGTLFSWAVVHRALFAPFKRLLPYVPAIMQIEEDPTVRVVTRVLDVAPAALKIGSPLEVRFEDFGYPVMRTGVVGPFCIVRTSSSKAP